jgi:hemerythrin-like domain-containing protein
MTSAVSELLVELRQDHKNMSFCLDILERESNRLYDDDEPDLELMHDVMTYMTVYPDAVHHPREDKLYAELRAQRPDLSSGMDRITVDHRKIAEEGFELRADIESAISGSPVHRNKVVSDALRYVFGLRSHMQWEELDLFRRCEKLVSEGQDIEVGSITVRKHDPLFGDQTEARFGKLLNSIRDSLQADHG